MTDRLFHAARLIAALLMATLVPLLIDRAARNPRRRHDWRTRGTTP